MAQEHGRQRRRRDPRRGRGRRRPEPQLRDELGPRQRGLLGRPDRRDLPRHRSGLRARDEGDEVPLGQGRLRLPEERPHRGRAAAVSGGLPAVHAGRPTTPSSRRWPATTSTRRSPTGRSTGRPCRPDDDSWTIEDSPLDEDESVNRFDPDLWGRALHHQRRPARRRVPLARHPRLHAGGLRADRPPTSRASSSRTTRSDIEAEFRRHLLFSLDLARLGRRSGEPELVPRQHGRATSTSTSSPSPTAIRRASQVTAKRSLGDVRLRYRINGGNVRQAPTKAAPGGERFNNDAGRLLPAAARRGEGHRAG